MLMVILLSRSHAVILSSYDWVCHLLPSLNRHEHIISYLTVVYTTFFTRPCKYPPTITIIKSWHYQLLNHNNHNIVIIIWIKQELVWDGKSSMTRWIMVHWIQRQRHPHWPPHQNELPLHVRGWNMDVLVLPWLLVALDDRTVTVSRLNLQGSMGLGCC